MKGKKEENKGERKKEVFQMNNTKNLK